MFRLDVYNTIIVVCFCLLTALHAIDYVTRYDRLEVESFLEEDEELISNQL